MVGSSVDRDKVWQMDDSLDVAQLISTNVQELYLVEGDELLAEVVWRTATLLRLFSRLIVGDGEGELSERK